MTIRSKIQDLIDNVRPFLVLIVCCVTSLLIATNVRCHGALAIYLYNDLPTYSHRNDVHWLGATHGMFVFLFVPMFTGIIDHFKVSYRICVVVAGIASLLSCLLSSGFADPGYMIFTDTVLAGVAASVLLSVAILVTDDEFPRGSTLRIFATTMVQGVAIATFFLIDAYSVALKLAGWRTVFYAYGGLTCGLGVLGGLLFVRGDQPHRYFQLAAPSAAAAAAAAADADVPDDRQEVDKDEDDDGGGSNDAVVDRVEEAIAAAGEDAAEDEGAAKAPGRGRHASVIDLIFEKKDWKKRLLSLSQTELDGSRTSLLWLLERLLAAIISDGIFLFLLMHSGITSHPYIAGAPTPSPKLQGITTAFLFTVGSTCSYLGGGILGCLITGRLLIMYMAGSLMNLCSLIGWVAVLDAHYHAELVFAWFCGLGVGAINTFAYAASEEATGIQARSIFPYTKLANGLSIVIIEVTHGALAGHGKSHMEVLLIVLLMLSLAEFALLVLIRQINRRLDASANRFRRLTSRFDRTAT